MSENRRAEVDAALAEVDFEKFNYQVVFETTKGTIKMDLYPDVAPGHCKNIIGLTKIGFYDGIIFHRSRSAARRVQELVDPVILSTQSSIICPTKPASSPWLAPVIPIQLAHSSSSAWDVSPTWTTSTPSSVKPVMLKVKPSFCRLAKSKRITTTDRWKMSKSLAQKSLPLQSS